MACRAISGLKFANVSKAGPPHFGTPRPRGAKAHGVRYEKELAKGIPVARHGQWFQFVDSNGHGWCQTDVIIEFPKCVLVLEAKYTWTWEGHRQVEGLYSPVVARAFQKPVIGLVVCRALISDMPGDLVVQSRLDQAALWAEKGKRVVLHWLGGTPFLKLEALEPRFGVPISPHTAVLVPKSKSA